MDVLQPHVPDLREDRRAATPAYRLARPELVCPASGYLLPIAAAIAEPERSAVTVPARAGQKSGGIGERRMTLPALRAAATTASAVSPASE